MEANGLKGKVVLVTGAASGIGLATSKLLAGHGAHVVLADRNGDAARAAAAAICAGGGQASAHDVDVGDSAQVTKLVADVTGAQGRIDVLLHAAGIYPKNPFLTMTDDEWRNVLRINLDGSFYVTREVSRVMAAQRSGTMILMTSDRGVYGSVDFVHYAVAKGGMIALVKSLALNMGKYGVTANGINPGLTDTPLARAGNPNWQAKQDIDVLGTHSKPEEIAEIVLFLAGTAGRFMTGQIVSTRMRHGN